MGFNMKKVLILQHVEEEGLGSFENLLVRNGFQPVPVLTQKDSFPEQLSPYAGLIILGGPMGAYEGDKFPFLKKEIELIQIALSKDIPILGICLGAQLMAKACGAEVYPGGKEEIGWYPIQMTEEAKEDNLFRHLNSETFVFQWHGDTFQLPEGAVRLASSELFPNQAFRLGKKSYGLQFHLEVTEQMICQWIEIHLHEISSLEGKANPNEMLKDTRLYISGLHHYGQRFFCSFLELF